MIADLKEVIAQLKELSTVVNSFKSEAVQLKIIELLLSSAPEDGGDEEREGEPKGATKKPKRTRRRVAKPSSGDTSIESGKKNGPSKRTSRAGQPGGKTLMTSLAAEGFFKKPKTLKAIIEHCEVNRATKFKQNELSGPLGRCVRDGILKRQKNADGQYEYTSN